MREVIAESFASPLLAAATLSRFLSYAGGLLAAGGMLFATAVHDRRPDDRARLSRAVTAAAAVAAIATVVGVALQGALVTGRAGALTDRRVLAAVLDSPFGTSAVVRVVALGVLSVTAALLWRRWAVALGLGAAVAVTGSFLLTGHTLAAEPGWLAVASGLAHTAAAAAWLGGLVLLGVTMRARRGEADAAGGAALVARFSTMATISVIVVSVAGAARVWTVMPVTAAALATGYGSTLAIKVLLVAVIFVVAGYNHRYLVPAVRAQTRGAAQRLRTTVRVEAVALIVVIAASAVLANLSPPQRTPAPAAGESSVTQGEPADR